MQAEDFPRFKAIMAGMAELFQRELSSQLMDVYWLALGRWNLAEFEEAAAHLVRTATFMPRPADFTKLEKAGAENAAEAWTHVLYRARNDSPNFMTETVQGLSPLANAALRAIGGLHTVAMSDPSKTQFLERRFNEAFAQLRESSEIRGELPQLTERVGLKALEGPQRASTLLSRKFG